MSSMEQNYTCVICKKSYSDLFSLFEHIITIDDESHKNYLDRDSIYGVMSCPSCRVVLNTRNDIITHFLSECQSSFVDNNVFSFLLRRSDPDDLKNRFKILLSLNKDLISTWIVGTKHEDALIRLLSINALKVLKDNRGFNSIVSLIDDPSPAVSNAAIFALGSFSNPKNGQIMVDLLSSIDEKKVSYAKKYISSHIPDLFPALLMKIGKESEWHGLVDFLSLLLIEYGDLSSLKSFFENLHLLNNEQRLYFFTCFYKKKKKNCSPLLLFGFIDLDDRINEISKKILLNQDLKSKDWFIEILNKKHHYLWKIAIQYAIRLNQYASAHHSGKTSFSVINDLKNVFSETPWVFSYPYFVVFSKKKLRKELFRIFEEQSNLSFFSSKNSHFSIPKEVVYSSLTKNKKFDLSTLNLKGDFLAHKDDLYKLFVSFLNSKQSNLKNKIFLNKKKEIISFSEK